MEHTLPHAYCWTSGLIEFGSVVPDGALELLEGHAAVPEEKRELIEVKARHGYDGALLVPGIPEEDDPIRKVTALIRFENMLIEALEGIHD